MLYYDRIDVSGEIDVKHVHQEIVIFVKILVFLNL